MARATYVAVPGTAGHGLDAAPQPLRHDGDARLRDEALRATLASAPAMLVCLLVVLACSVLLLPGSPWRWAWAAVSLAALAAWAVTLDLYTLRASLRRRRQRAFVPLVVACLLLVALAPWIPGAAAPFLFLFSLGTVALAGAMAFAPLRGLMAMAAVLPLSAVVAEWVQRRGGPEDIVAGLLLAVGSVLAGEACRRRWLRAARASLQREDRMRETEAERDAAIRSDQEKSRFLAVASHDLRQPMHALGLFAATLERKVQGSGEALLVHNLVRSIDSLDRSFNVMLDVSRLDAGTMEPNFQRFPLRDLFRRLHMHFAGQAEQAGLGLRFSPGGKSVTSDPQLLERLLGNLIQNAIKYTEHGGIVVVARSTEACINVEVWDTGTGIDDADLPRIFDEFYQAGRGPRSRDRGFGMGLAIVKRLALLLGHRLLVASQPGRGTMFRIGIPVGGLGEIQDVTAAADTLPMPLPITQARTVLIVDDEAAIREGLALLLEEWGYQALAAGSAEQAVHLLHRLDAPPDVILSDLHLGDGPDGIAAIEAVRRECGFDVAAILVTGDTSHEELRRATDSGHPVLFKPVQPRKLLNALRGYIP